jgi:hypothetical protein
MKVLGIAINAINKLRVVLIILMLLSFSVMAYNIERIVNKESNSESQQSEIALHVIMIMGSVLTCFVNLLLYQGALDLNSIDLYWWPDPKVCKSFWLVIYVSIAAIYIYAAATCFYFAIKGNENGNIFVNPEDNFLAWGFIYLFGDSIVAASIYFVIKLYSKI